MNLHLLLKKRASEGRPVRVGLIGAGKFGAMYLSQAQRTAGIHLVGVADLSPANAKRSLLRVEWPKEQLTARTLEAAAKSGKTCITDDSAALIASPFIDVIIDATGSPAAGIAHVLACCENGKDIVMVNVEADALAGPLLARKAAEAGIVYSLAYGDQPALICEQVDWARAAGFEVIAAGKGTKYLPSFHQSTPETVWGHYGLTAEAAKVGGMNPQMFNSFLDGTKSAIEMAAVSNATGLLPADDGLHFPPCGVDDLARILKPKSDGGQLQRRGQVEVISSVERDGRPVFRDLRWGVYVTFAAPTDYVKRCFAEYGLVTDNSGVYSSMYKPFHLIGLELGISVASVALRKEATGAAQAWHGDVVATAKSDLKAGTILDGEGGFCVYGKLMPAKASMTLGGLPLGLAHGVKLKRKVVAGQVLQWNDVEFDPNNAAVQFRREMETVFGDKRLRG
jgi:predicted homoserine dehydrogenase-like protein